MFQNRTAAGKELALCLEEYQDRKNAVVLGLPRGGVTVAYEVAKALHLPLDVICPRKVGAPHNKELAIGAVTETGEGYFNDDLIYELGISDEYVKIESEKEKEEARMRMEIFRKGLPPQDFENKILILVDDGLATGATMKAAVQAVKSQNPERIIVAVPVAPVHTVEEIDVLADEVICIDTPSFFQAVGQFYVDFNQVDDVTVIKLLEKNRLERSSK